MGPRAESDLSGQLLRKATKAAPAEQEAEDQQSGLGDRRDLEDRGRSTLVDGPLKLQVPPPVAEPQLTGVMPSGKVEPEAGVQVIVPQLPVGVGAGR